MFNLKIVLNGFLRCFSFLMMVTAAFLPCSCASVKEKGCPYEIHGEMKLYDEACGGCSFKVTLLNKGSETLKNCTIVFSLFNGDGEPAFSDADYVEYKSDVLVPGGGQIEISVPIEQYFDTEPEYEYLTDYIFLKEIVWESGEVWTDYFGQYAS